MDEDELKKGEEDTPVPVPVPVPTVPGHLPLPPVAETISYLITWHSPYGTHSIVKNGPDAAVAAFMAVCDLPGSYNVGLSLQIKLRRAK
jgi:hypothetical protein